MAFAATSTRPAGIIRSTVSTPPRHAGWSAWTRRRLFLFRNDLLLDLVIGRLRDHFLSDQFIFAFVGTVLHDLLRIGFADSRERLQLLDRSRIDIQQIAGGLAGGLACARRLLLFDGSFGVRGKSYDGQAEANDPNEREHGHKTKGFQRHRVPPW